MGYEQPVKVPGGLLVQADSLIKRIEAHPDLVEWGRISRTAIIRIALARGLKDLEREVTRREQAKREAGGG